MILRRYRHIYQCQYCEYQGLNQTNNYLEKYNKEIEYSFTNLFYVNTLFSAMFAMKEKGVYSFVAQLGKEMKAYFPDFEQNKYYQEAAEFELYLPQTIRQDQP